MRCNHCEKRNGWICGDGWNRTENDIYCNDFVLDFFTLSDKQKKEIQKKLMKENSDE